MHEIQDYLTPEGKDPFKNWLESVVDRMARARVLARVQRMGAGNFGDCKPLNGGVWELRIDQGPGYRVYYAKAGSRLILLLIGGDKTGDKRWYETHVPIADRLYDAHLEQLKKEGLING